MHGYDNKHALICQQYGNKLHAKQHAHRTSLDRDGKPCNAT